MDDQCAIERHRLAGSLESGEERDSARLPGALDDISDLPGRAGIPVCCFERALLRLAANSQSSCFAHESQHRVEGGGGKQESTHGVGLDPIVRPSHAAKHLADLAIDRVGDREPGADAGA